MAGTLGASKLQYPGGRNSMPEVLNILGGFVTNGAAPSRSRGKGFVVSQVGTGLYRVQFNINTPRMLVCNPCLVKAAASATWVELADLSATNNYATFRIINGSGAAVAPGALTDEVVFDMNIMTVKLPLT